MSKRKRDPTFASSEKLTLIELVTSHFDIVESKKTDNVNIKMKNEEWQKIATEFNAISSIHPRDWGVLKNCWENLKKRAKQIQTLRNQHFLGTGGGPPKKMIEDPATDRVLELIQSRVTGFTNCYDSDGTLVLASGSNVSTQHGEGTSELNLPASENAVPSHHEECSNDANLRESPMPEQVIEVDWSQYTPSMLRVARNPALADNEDDVMADMGQLPVADSQLPVADPQRTLLETQQQGINTPVRASITRVAPAAMNAAGTTRVAAAAMNAATTSRRRPTSRREREGQNLTTARINTMLQCNVHAEEEHAMQIKILQLQEQREKEIYAQEKLKTEQEKIKLEILKIQLQKLKE